MVDLKEYIEESLMDDFDDIATTQDGPMLHPFTWFHDKAIECRNGSQLLKLVQELHSIISLKEYGTEIKPKGPRPKTGLYSQWWDLNAIRRWPKTALLCKFYELKDSNFDKYNGCVLTVGFGSRLSESLTLKIGQGSPHWIISGCMTGSIISNESKVYLINSDSSFYSEYKEMANELGIK